MSTLHAKVVEVLNDWTCSRNLDKVADAILAAVGEGQEPVAWRRVSNITGVVTGVFLPGADIELKTENLEPLFAAPQPAPDVVAMQARIAELERQAGDAARKHNADVSTLEEKLLQRTLEKAEIERVQGVLVDALEGLMDGSKFYAVDPIGFAWHEKATPTSAALSKARAALAAVQKPEGGNRGSDCEDRVKAAILALLPKALP